VPVVQCEGGMVRSGDCSARCTGGDIGGSATCDARCPYHDVRFWDQFRLKDILLVGYSAGTVLRMA
jgi:hypothetical protein